MLEKGKNNKSKALWKTSEGTHRGFKGIMKETKEESSLYIV